MEQRPIRDALRQRYGNSDQPSPFAVNDTLSLLLEHRSVRAYSPAALPSDTLETVVAAAQSAASSSNLQAWSVVAVEDQDRKARLALLAGDQAHIRACPLFLVWLADLSRLAHMAEQRGIAHDGLDYTEMFMLAIVDATLAAQNAVVAAESLGLGTVYIGGIRNYPLDVAAELRLPPRVFGIFGLCIGWPDPAEPATIKPRLPQSAVLHREMYQVAAQDAAVVRYSETMAAFYADENMRGNHDWAQRSSRRVSGPQALSGRDTIRESLHRLGFELR